MNGADSPRGNPSNRGGDQAEHMAYPGGGGWPLPRRLAWLLFSFFLLAAPAGAAPGIPGPFSLDGYQIPIFATADEQLGYARSTFTETEEKSAALKAVARLHPAAREQAAMAALELAFLALGDDYRLADKDQYRLAGCGYQAVLEHYADLPAIAAKALWYLGWIAGDLEGDRRRGIGWYQRLIALYPKEVLSTATPAPWLTIRPAEPEARPPAAYPKTVLTWADIAHLEIIRHTADREQAWQSFAAIEAGTDPVFIAGALKVLIERHGFDARSERLAREYVAKPGSDPVLRHDLLLALSAHRPQSEPPGGPR